MIEGDIASDVDARKVAKTDVDVVQINTRGACHLDANMILSASESLGLDGKQLLIIENVGNLVCPAEFRLGENIKVMILSIPEGHDKPLKYPLMFTESGALILNKDRSTAAYGFRYGRIAKNGHGHESPDSDFPAFGQDR